MSPSRRDPLYAFLTGLCFAALAGYAAWPAPCAGCPEEAPPAPETRASAVLRGAALSGVEPALALATSMTENWSGDRKAWSPTGCCVGVMQVHTMHLGVYDSLCGGSDLLSLRDNACYGAAILARYLKECGGEEKCALRRYVGADTSNPARYINDVLQLRARLREAMEGGNAAGVVAPLPTTLLPLSEGRP